MNMAFTDLPAFITRGAQLPAGHYRSLRRMSEAAFQKVLQDRQRWMDSRVSTFANFSALVKELFPSIAKPRYRDKTAARTQSMARQGQSLRIEKPVTVPAPRRGRGGGGGGNLKRMFGMAGQALTSLMPLPASATSHDIARQQYGRTVNLHPEEYPFG